MSSHPPMPRNNSTLTCFQPWVDRPVVCLGPHNLALLARFSRSHATSIHMRKPSKINSIVMVPSAPVAVASPVGPAEATTASPLEARDQLPDRIAHRHTCVVHPCEDVLCKHVPAVMGMNSNQAPYRHNKASLARMDRNHPHL